MSDVTAFSIMPLKRAPTGQRLIEQLAARVGAWPEPDVEPIVHHVETWRYLALVTHLETHPRSLVDLFPWTPERTHGRATLFLPVKFKKAFQLEAQLVGSVVVGAAVIDAWYWPGETAPAVQVMKAALADALRLKLPLLVG